MKKTLLILLLTLALPAFLPCAALAAGGKIRFGNLAIVPSMGVDEIYDDNIYYDKHNKESDWITQFRPGLMLDYTIQGRGKFKLGYKGLFAYYSDNKDNDWKRHELFFDLNYLSPGGLIVKIKNSLVHSKDPYGGLNEYKLGRQTERWFNDLKTEVGFKFSERLRLLAYYNFYRQDYKNNSGIYSSGGYANTGYNSMDIPYYYYGEDYNQDYYYNEAGLGVETKVAHKTWAFLRYHNGRQNYFTHRNGVTSSNDASYDWQRVNTGLTWDDGGRYAGEINFGYQWNSHNNSRDRNGYRYKDHDNWIAGTRFIFRQNEGRKFIFTVQRELYQLEAGVSGYFRTTRFGIGVEQRIKSRFLVLLGYSLGKNKHKSEGYSANSPYFSDSRKDTVHRVTTSLKYEIKEWLIAGFEYNYFHNNSNDSYSGYKINRFGISLDFKPAAYH
ncbi:MAG: outer membrane beta-barrel protein [Deltaproteobacteria bacterium]|nr:outer membrane beta-barrel protein [Deltaproteobacteria bacterium]